MNLFSAAPDWAIWILIALLTAAALQDAVQLRISNYITASVLILGIAAMVVTGGTIGLWKNALLFALVLTVGAFLFARNVLGGGDVKLFAAVALWSDLGGALRLIAFIFVCGGLLALLILVARTMSPQWLADRVKTLRPRAGIPYGIAIAAGTILTITLVQEQPGQKSLSTIAPIPKVQQQSGN